MVSLLYKYTPLKRKGNRTSSLQHTSSAISSWFRILWSLLKNVEKVFLVSAFTSKKQCNNLQLLLLSCAHTNIWQKTNNYCRKYSLVRMGRAYFWTLLELSWGEPSKKSKRPSLLLNKQVGKKLHHLFCQLHDRQILYEARYPKIKPGVCGRLEDILGTGVMGADMSWGEIPNDQANNNWLSAVVYSIVRIPIFYHPHFLGVELSTSNSY